MEGNDNSLKQLKDQMNSLKPEPGSQIDLADYNAYQFARTLKPVVPTTIRNKKHGNTLVKVQSKEIIPRALSSRDISYRKDILNFAHHKNCTKGELTERVKNMSNQRIPIGSATSFAKHRRSESTHIPGTADVAQSYPTDIKHLEKLIQFTGPNHRNISGGRTCQRESCINHNALLNPKVQAYWGTEKSQKELQDEDNLMHQLEVFYKKNTDFTYDVVKKSALESNMFSRKRVTLEGLMKATSSKRINKNVIDEETLNAIFNSNDRKNKPEKAGPKNELDILMLLQERDLQNARKNDLGEPTGRREVELLNQWLDQMLNTYVFSKGNIRKDPEKRKEALYHAKLILSICLRDLIRQVSVQ